jgi:hypothetical protein
LVSGVAIAPRDARCPWQELAAKERASLVLVGMPGDWLAVRDLGWASGRFRLSMPPPEPLHDALPPVVASAKFTQDLALIAEAVGT